MRVFLTDEHSGPVNAKNRLPRRGSHPPVQFRQPLHDLLPGKQPLRNDLVDKPSNRLLDDRPCVFSLPTSILDPSTLKTASQGGEAIRQSSSDSRCMISCQGSSPCGMIS